MDMSEAEFQELYDRYKNLVMDCAYRITGDYYVSQDICQETFIKLYGYQDKLDESRLKGWLVVVSTNLAIDHKRKCRNRREVSDEYGADGGIPEQEDEFWTSVERKRLYRNMLRALYERNRDWYEVFLLVEELGVPRKDVAKKRKVSLSTVDQYLRKGKKWMKENFLDEYDDLQ